MNDLFSLASPELMRLGWALVHCLWQGAIIGAVLELSLLLAGRKNANLRYLLCALALVAMPICFAVTYAMVGQGSHVPVTLPELSMTATPVQSVTTPSAISSPVVQARPEISSSRFSEVDWNRCMAALALLWLAGVVLLALRKAGGFIVLGRLRRTGVSAPDAALAALFQAACDRIGVDGRRVALKISEIVAVPMTMGWLRPVILFPAALLSGLGTREIEMLLAHELAHIRRRDYLVNLLQTVVETFFFYHPVTWWISRRMRQERENCCDDLVASKSNDALAYAKVLLRLESMRPPEAFLAAANGGNLRQRIERLLGNSSAGSATRLPLLLAFICILGLITATTFLRAQGTPQAPKPSVTMTADEAKQKGIAALVNGKPILWTEVDKQSQQVVKQLKEDCYLSGDELNQKIAEARKNVVKALIDRQLIIDDYKANGGVIPRQYIDERINDIVQDEYHGDRAAFLKTIAQRGATLEKMERELEENAIVGYQRNKNVDAKVFEYYQNHLDQFPEDERISATLIVINGDEHTTVSDHAHNPQYAVAQQALAEVKKGADFSTLAQKYLKNDEYLKNDAYLANGPTFWLSSEDPVDIIPSNDPDGWQALDKIQPGHTSGILDGNWFYAIARVNQRLPATVSETEKTKNQRKTVLYLERERIRKEWLDNLRAKYPVQSFELANAAPAPDPTVQSAASQPSPAPAVPQSGKPAATTSAVEAKQDDATVIVYKDGKPTGTTMTVEQALAATVQNMKQRLQLNDQQAATLYAAMVANHNRTATKTVPQTLKEILSPKQEAMWEEVKNEDIKAAAGRLASRDVEWIGQDIHLDDDQKPKVYNAFYAYELAGMRAPDNATYAGDIRNAPYTLGQVLSAVLTPEQTKLYKIAAEARLMGAPNLVPPGSVPLSVTTPLPTASLAYALHLSYWGSTAGPGGPLASPPPATPPAPTKQKVLDLPDAPAPAPSVRGTVNQPNPAPAISLTAYALSAPAIPPASVPVAQPAVAPVAPENGKPSAADSPVQQNYIASQMKMLKEDLHLTDQQAATLYAAMEAVVHETATKTVDQTLKEILDPRQEAAWEEFKHAGNLAEASRYASFEILWMDPVVHMTDDQKKKVFDALCSIRLKAPAYFHSMQEMAAHMDVELAEKVKALSGILTPGQMVLYQMQAEKNLQQNKKQMGLGLTNEPAPPVDLTIATSRFHPVPPQPPPPLSPLPYVSLAYSMSSQPLALISEGTTVLHAKAATGQ